MSMVNLHNLPRVHSPHSPWDDSSMQVHIQSIGADPPRRWIIFAWLTAKHITVEGKYAGFHANADIY